MRFLKTLRRKTPNSRLLPMDAYPAHLDQGARDRVDRTLREQMHTIPAEPGEYLDNQEEVWNFNADGSSTDCHGETRSNLYRPILSTFGPFTRVGPAPVAIEVTARG